MDVIHLSVRQRHANRSLACVDVRPRVVGEDVSDRILWINPDVVAVAAACLFLREFEWATAIAAERLATILRAVEAAARNEDVVRILRVDRQANVVAGAADERAIPAHRRPGRPGIVASPERSLVGGLNQGVHPLRIRRRDCDINLAHRRLGHPVGDLRPLRAAVVRDVHPAARAAAQLRPRVLLHLPRSCEERVGIALIHREPRAARLLIDKQDALPCCAAVDGLEHATLFLRAGQSALGADEYDVRVRGMDQDARDAACFRQAHVLPGRAGVRRLVDAVTDDVDVADHPRLAGADPDDLRVGVCYRNAADGRDGLVVENRVVGVAAIRGLPESTGRRTEVVRVGISWNSGRGGDAAIRCGAHVSEP